MDKPKPETLTSSELADAVDGLLVAVEGKNIYPGYFADAARRLRARGTCGECDRLKEFLEREGYRRCDVPACNCGSFHKAERREGHDA